eukprot:COSAG01_NODE_68385_length_264_cov_0.630303_1_plen_20_part_01
MQVTVVASETELHAAVAAAG